MASLSLALIVSLVVQSGLVFPADAAISLPSLEPAAAGPTAAPGDVCGGCYVVADVAGIVFGTETLTQTHTLLTSIGVGLNGTNTTTTSFIEGTGQFTFNTGGILGVAASTSFDVGPTITFSGVALTSPTVYNVFTAYSVTSTTTSNGVCVQVPGPKVTVPAFQVPMPPNVDAGQFAEAAESSFISYLGLITCSAGGENAATTSHFQLTNTTTTTTTTGPIHLTPQPAVTVAPTTATATTTTTTTSLVSTISSLTNATPASASSLSIPVITTTASVGSVIIVGNSTFLPTGFGPNATIVPNINAAADWKSSGDSLLLLWGTGILSTVVAIWAL